MVRVANVNQREIGAASAPVAMRLLGLALIVFLSLFMAWYRGVGLERPVFVRSVGAPSQPEPFTGALGDFSGWRAFRYLDLLVLAGAAMTLAIGTGALIGRRLARRWLFVFGVAVACVNAIVIYRVLVPPYHLSHDYTALGIGAVTAVAGLTASACVAIALALTTDSRVRLAEA